MIINFKTCKYIQFFFKKILIDVSIPFILQNQQQIMVLQVPLTYMFLFKSHNSLILSFQETNKQLT